MCTCVCMCVHGSMCLTVFDVYGCIYHSDKRPSLNYIHLEVKALRHSADALSVFFWPSPGLNVCVCVCVRTSTGPCYVGRSCTALVACCHWPWSPGLPALV